jgi:hypothetical protein
MSSGVIAPRLQRRNSFSNTARHAYGRTKKRIDIAYYQHYIYALLRPNQHIRRIALASPNGSRIVRAPWLYTTFGLPVEHRFRSLSWAEPAYTTQHLPLAVHCAPACGCCQHKESPLLLLRSRLQSQGDSIKQSSIICASLMLAQIKATALYDVSLANRGSRCSRSWAPPA